MKKERKNQEENRKKKKVLKPLSPELWENIFYFLSIEEFQKIRKLSKSIYKLSWKNILKDQEFQISTSMMPFNSYDFSFVSQLTIIHEQQNEDEEKEKKFFNTKENLTPLMNIERLILQGTTINDSGMKYLLGKQHNIKSLDLGMTVLTDESLKFCAGISKLNLSYCGITDKGLKYLKGVEELDLSYCEEISDEGLKYIKGVQSLDLNNCINIGDKGLKYIQGVNDLQLGFNLKVTDEGIQSLKGIKEMSISFCSISSQAFKGLKGIEHLTLCLDQIIDGSMFQYLEGIQELMIVSPMKVKNEHFKYLSNIKELKINSQDLTDEAFKYMKELESLNIANCSKIAGSGFKYLKNLKELTLGDLEINENIESSIDFVNDKLLENVEKYLTNLERICLFGCTNFSSSSLKFLKRIQYLNFGNCEQLNYKDLMSLENAKEAQITGTKITLEEKEKIKRKLNIEFLGEENSE